MYLKNDYHHQIKNLFQRPEIRLAGLYFLIFLLVLMPYYNWWYRISVNLLYFPTRLFSLFVLLFILIPFYIYKRAWKAVCLTFLLSLLIYLIGPQVQQWRYYLTDRYIQKIYCLTNPVTGEPPLADNISRTTVILEGIRGVMFEGVKATRLFETPLIV
jgi:hypothetical protein